MKSDKINDFKYESFMDNYLYFPIAEELLDTLHKNKITPNMVTLASTILTLYSAYLIFKKDKNFILFYLAGYLLDCIDGKLARKYNQTSKFGMMMDLLSDNFSNGIILFILFSQYNTSNNFIMLLIFILLLGLSYGYNEAQICFEKHNHDDFLYQKKMEMKDYQHPLKNIYLQLYANTYHIYKYFFNKFDSSHLPVIKEFGPGNFSVIFVFLVSNIISKGYNSPFIPI